MVNIKKLQECSCAADAAGLIPKNSSNLTRETLNDAYSFMNAPDQQTKAYGQRLFARAIKEMEDDEKHMKEDTAYNHQGGEKDVEKKVTEEQLMHPRDSEGSSDSTLPLSGEGTDAPESDIESMQTASGDKIGGDGNTGAVAEANPIHIAGVDPKTVSEMTGNRNVKLPALTTRQIIRTIQYNVQEYLKPYEAVIRKHQEALVALGKQVQETKVKSGEMKIDLNSLKTNAIAKPHGTRETVSILQADPNATPIELPPVDYKSMKTQEARTAIAQLDNQIEQTRNKSPYQ